MSTREELNKIEDERMKELKSLTLGLAMEVQHVLRHRRKCCLTCVQFDQEREVCRLADQRPPVRVLVYGCASYEWDEIPF